MSTTHETPTAESITALLKGAKHSSVMETVYRIEDGPIVPQGYGNGNIRIEQVVVRVHDTGYREVSVQGRSVTKTGVFKSGMRFHADLDITDAFVKALLNL